MKLDAGRACRMIAVVCGIEGAFCQDAGKGRGPEGGGLRLQAGGYILLHAYKGSGAPDICNFGRKQYQGEEYGASNPQFLLFPEFNPVDAC